MKTIKTSQKGWLKAYAKQVDKQSQFTIIDDAKIGINPKKESLLEMGKKADLDIADWMAALISLGVSGAGLWMIRLAIIDPEPTSKLALLFMSGVVLVGLGGMNAIKILTSVMPLGCSIKKSQDGFIIKFS